MEAHRQKLADEQQRQKDDRAALRKKMREGGAVEALAADAAKRAKTFEKNAAESKEEAETRDQRFDLKGNLTPL